MKIAMELTAARRFMTEMRAQQRIRERIAEAARLKADTCQCVLCVARRTGDPLQMLDAVNRLVAAGENPHEAPRATQ